MGGLGDQATKFYNSPPKCFQNSTYLKMFTHDIFKGKCLAILQKMYEISTHAVFNREKGINALLQHEQPIVSSLPSES